MSSRYATLILATLLGAALPAARLAAGDAPPASPDAIQMLADVTLIDGGCRNVEVDFGRAFQKADGMGLRAVDIMPTGRLRAAFETVERKRLAETDHTALCDTLARAYASEVPGLLRFR